MTTGLVFLRWWNYILHVFLMSLIHSMTNQLHILFLLHLTLNGSAKKRKYPSSKFNEPTSL